MDLGEITVKLLIGFTGLWLMTRWLGKKEISQLTPFDFVSSLMLSELVGNTVYAKEVNVLQLLFALLLWAVLSYIFEKLTRNFRALRQIMDGKPAILIRRGEVDLKEMRRNSLDFDQLRMLLRQHGIFYIGDVDYAIFEANGTLSVLKKPEANEGEEKESASLHKEDSELSYNLIEDGRLIRSHLKRIGKDEQWMMQELQRRGYGDMDSIAYAEWQRGRGLFVLEHKERSALPEDSEI